MNFDPKPTPLRSQKDVFEYLARYDVNLVEEFTVEWCPLKTDVMVAHPHGGVFIHPQILSLGMKLPLTDLVRNVLVFFKVALPQLTVGAWRVLLTFEVLCNRFLPKACRREEFCVVYMMRKGMVTLVPSPPQRGCDKLVVNIPDSNHGWRDSVVRITGPWEALAENHGRVLMSWNTRPVRQESESMSRLVQERS